MSVRVVGPTETFTDLQDAINDLDTTLGGVPFTENHFIQVQTGATGEAIVVPSSLVPIGAFRLFIAGQFKDRPLIRGFTLNTRFVTLSDLDISGTDGLGSKFTDGAVVVNLTSNGIEVLRSKVHDATTLINFQGISSVDHKVHNCELFNFENDGIFKQGGNVELLHNSAFNRSDNVNVTSAIVHTIDADLTMKQNSWYVMGDNPNHYTVRREKTTAVADTLDFSKNHYFMGYAELESEAKVAIVEDTDFLVDHDIIVNIGNTTTFEDPAADFVASGVQVGDILTFETNIGDLVDGGSVITLNNVGQYEVVNVLSSTQLLLGINTTTETGQFEYIIRRITSTEFTREQVDTWGNENSETVPTTGDPDYADLGIEGTGPTSLIPGAISPVIQVGTPIVDVPNDIDGNIRPGDAVTVGAYEARATVTPDGIFRILELIGGLSTQAVVKVGIGDEGEFASNPMLPEAPIQGNIGLDNPLVFIPLKGATATGGVLELMCDFFWRFLIPPGQPVDFTEIQDQIITTFTEVGLFTEDNVMILRFTLPEFSWDILSRVTPRVTIQLRFEGKVIEQFFHPDEGFRLPNPASELIFEDWRAFRKVT